MNDTILKKCTTTYFLALAKRYILNYISHPYRRVVNCPIFVTDFGNGNSMRRESSSAGKSSHHTSRHSRGTGSITYGIRTIVDKDPRFQSIPKTFRVPESEKVILPCYTENLGK